MQSGHNFAYDSVCACCGFDGWQWYKDIQTLPLDLELNYLRLIMPQCPNAADE